MLNKLITSETRVRLLLRFLLNPEARGYLRQLAKEFNESTNGIRVELNRLDEAQILKSHTEGRNKIFQANTDHPLFNELRNIVLKSTGIDKVISDILHKIGKLELAFIRGDYALGKDSGLIDLVIVGEDINLEEVERVRLKTEKLINRKIVILNLTKEEYQKLQGNFQKASCFILFSNKNNSGELQG
ncbi:MAG: ArsR family transcriptional regulator [Calditrichaceae bacterium]|nr:ArsR family transcriptional regulator [Calditrichaceae bacterium]MBN2710262.1 ArsR family transcriptional regulator [Calditrichaceae bacterium]